MDSGSTHRHVVPSLDGGEVLRSWRTDRPSSAPGPDAGCSTYGGVLGLSLEDVRPFALVADTGATQLRITAAGTVHVAPSPCSAGSSASGLPLF
jgi:hypothetical protein